MATAFSRVCAALAEVGRRQPELLAGLRFRILGTYAFWQPGDPTPLKDLADAAGLGSVVEEIPPWISYSRAMKEMEQSDALLILGVDDAGYVPSKLFGYALTGKPLLACLRSDSPAAGFFQALPSLGHLVTFDRTSIGTGAETAVQKVSEFLTQVRQCQRVDRRALLSEYLAPAMARRHADLFERICLAERHGKVSG